MPNLSCFKAYDIRGLCPEDLDADLARKIGRAYVQEFAPRSVVVGYDARLESPKLAAALEQGLMEAGADVLSIGLCGTEEVYFHTFHREGQGIDGGIMVTASHNPKGYNGMKLVTRGARPISAESGLAAIRERIASGGTDSALAAKPGQRRFDPDKSAYAAHLLGQVDLSALRPLKILADPGNGSAGPALAALQSRLPFEFVTIRDEPDGHFPSGVPNPLLPENRQETASAVLRHGADLGIAWDGDFDRCFLFDAQGRFIEGYYLVGLLAEMMLVKTPGSRIVHDPRLTWNTIEQVIQAGGQPVQSKTGHAFIKESMRREDAVYGGEMSGHHYFRDFAYCDSGMLPWLLIAEAMCRFETGLAELVDRRMAAFPCSGEINFRVESPQATIERILGHYAAGGPEIDRTDGVSLAFADWRFNLRASNTEPLLRLNVESRGDEALVAARLAELRSLIAGAP